MTRLPPDPFAAMPGLSAVAVPIWEPLSTWEKIFDQDGKANALLGLYDQFKTLYLAK